MKSKLELKIRRAAALLFLAGAMSGCAHALIVPFQSTVPKKYPRVNPVDVGIYRSTQPFSSFTELGAITYRVSEFDLPQMYDQLRKDAGEYGAQAVVDVRITGETHTEFEVINSCTPSTTCNAEGSCSTSQDCHTEQVPVDVSTFLIAGSMIRRFEDSRKTNDQ